MKTDNLQDTQTREISPETAKLMDFRSHLLKVEALLIRYLENRKEEYPEIWRSIDNSKRIINILLGDSVESKLGYLTESQI